MARVEPTSILGAAPLTKAEFLAHCHWRNPDFRDFVVRVWQALPPVLKRARPTPAGSIRVVDPEASETLLPRPPEEPAALPVQDPLPGDYVALRPRTFAQHAQAARTLKFLTMGVLSGWTAVPFSTLEYSSALGLTQEDCRSALERFKRECSDRWPRWGAGRLVSDPHAPGWWMARPDVVVRGPVDVLPPLHAVPAEPAAFRAAAIWLPVYEDTTARSVDWEAIGQLQKKVYGPPQRARGESLYARLIYIWDQAYDGRRTFGEIARELIDAESTVRSRAYVVGRIIRGTQDSRQVTEALRALPTVDRDLRKCTTCSKATSVDGFCRRHRELVEPSKPSGKSRSKPK